MRAAALSAAIGVALALLALWLVAAALEMPDYPCDPRVTQCD